MPEVLLTSRMVSKKGTSLAGEDSGRPGRNLSVVRDLRIFIVQIIVKKALEGKVAETLDWSITLEKAALFERDDFQLDSSWLDRSARDRANRVKGSLTTTHGIGASRIFLSGEVFIDPASDESLAKFDLTD